MACTFISLAKGVTIGSIVLFSISGPPPCRLNLEESSLLVSTLFIPQLLIAIFSTIGYSVNSIKTLFNHPELLILPTGLKKEHVISSYQICFQLLTSHSPSKEPFVENVIFKLVLANPGH